MEVLLRYCSPVEIKPQILQIMEKENCDPELTEVLSRHNSRIEIIPQIVRTLMDSRDCRRELFSILSARGQALRPLANILTSAGSLNSLTFEYIPNRRGRFLFNERVLEIIARRIVICSENIHQNIRRLQQS